MGPVLDSFFAGFPLLITHFAVTLGILALGAVVYHLITPYHEIALIKRGNTAAAASLGGAIVGLAVPLAACMATSAGTIDIGVVVAGAPRRGRSFSAAPESLRVALGQAAVGPPSPPPRAVGDHDFWSYGEELRTRRTVAKVLCRTEVGRRRGTPST